MSFYHFGFYVVRNYTLSLCLDLHILRSIYLHVRFHNVSDNRRGCCRCDGLHRNRIDYRCDDEENVGGLSGDISAIR